MTGHDQLRLGQTSAAVSPASVGSPDADLKLWLDPVTVETTRLRALLDQAARGVGCHAILAGALLATFWTSPALPLVIAICLAAMTGLSLALLVGHIGLRGDLSRRGTRLGSGIATAFAAWLGLAWSAAPLLLLGGVDEAGKLVLLALVLVVLGDAQRLGAPRSIGLAYVVPVCLGSMIGFVAGGDALGFGMAIAVPFYGRFVIAHGVPVDGAARRAIVDAAVALAQSDTIHSLLLDFAEESGDWLWRTTGDGRLVHVTEGAVDEAAALLAGATDAPFATLFTRQGARPTDGARAVLSSMAAKKPFRNRLVEIRGEAGANYWWRLCGEPLFDAAGQFLGYRGIGSDVSGARNSESRIAYLASYDALTGFANRASFQAFAARQCHAAEKDGWCRALLCLDIDGFKSVNDTFGHDSGDELLKQVAARLTLALPTGTFVARIGGDEFAVWLQNTTPTKAEALATTLAQALRAPFEVDGTEVNVGGSVGLALTPQHGVDAEKLLVKADLALYRSKTSGKGRATIFDISFEKLVAERRALEADLKLALARGEFLLHYQPLADLADGRVVCFEALIRWQSPTRGFVSPVDFVPAAESAGLIAAIGRYVLFEACRTASTWPQDIELAVNISPPHVRSADFLQDVTLALKSSGLHPSRLQIEVTEGVFLDRSTAAASALQTLRTRGVKIALDDFGTGYSSLNYLIDFPVDKIKIDRAFVRDLVASDRHRAIVDAMLGLARSFGIRVTAEGVETREQVLALKRRRCDDIQGFLLSKPRPAADVAEMIAEVPLIFRKAVPTHLESPLALALAARKLDVEQAA